MRVFDESNAEVLVYTFKEGLLSAAAHDLKLRVGHFRIRVSDDGSSVEASFDPSSITVVCARKDGADAPHALLHAMHADIEKNIERDVLSPRRFPDISFDSTSVTDDAVAGTLKLHGASRPVRVARSKGSDGAELGRATLDQRDFGIKPFTAMLGTLKIRPDVEIEVRLRASVGPA